MKIKVVLIALFVFAIAACTQRTCPTYTQDTSEEVKTEVKKS